ncbi:aspartate aminotransferase family protein [Pseudoclavibacter sp. RFBB5]|uniref:aspartate aminotransferase family protein n=1 Tax=Pseudoclavibacter sp. RFBB5 TaxID=2080574 RepID=UPI001CA50CD4|nr:aminotransferase class III-fold pyridoxal phosphate-dependent enzyme [Pseudoclavibacter sp. RFBB5]
MSRSTIMDGNSYRAGESSTAAGTSAMIERRTRLLGPSYRLFYSNPVHLVRGSGTYLYDSDGVEYLDMYNNVASLGHAHPRVVEAMAAQAGTLNTHTRYLHEAILDYTEDLLSTMPAEIGQVMYQCTGSEANDLALRVAAAYTGGSGVIVTSEAYHGTSGLTSAVSPALGSGQTLGLEVRTVPGPDTYRTAPELVGEKLAADIRAAIADLAKYGVKFSAFLADSVFSSDGVAADPAGFLRPAFDAVHEAGGVWIADEVQPGFGRLGPRMWGFARHDIVPDIVTMGKPMGNGIPVSGMAARPEVLEPFATGIPYFNTFGGNPVAITAAQAVLDVLRDEGLPERAAVVGDQLRAAIRSVGDSRIGDVRGAGQFTGVEIVVDPASKTPDGATALALVNALREHRVLTSTAGPNNNVLKVRPPLSFQEHDIDRFTDALAAALADVPAR